MSSNNVHLYLSFIDSVSTKSLYLLCCSKDYVPVGRVCMLLFEMAKTDRLHSSVIAVGSSLRLLLLRSRDCSWASLPISATNNQIPPITTLECIFTYHQ